MLYRKIIAVCSQINIKHINTLCGQNVEFLPRDSLLLRVTCSCAIHTQFFFYHICYFITTPFPI